MNAFELLGIDGGNPLGFMAALGVLRAVTIADPLARMGWLVDATPPRPTMHTALDENGAADAVLAEAGIASKVIENLGDDICRPLDKWERNWQEAACKALEEWHNMGCLPGMPSPTDYFAAFVSANGEGNDSKRQISWLDFCNAASSQYLFKNFRKAMAILVGEPTSASRLPNAPDRQQRGRDLIVANIFRGENYCSTQKGISMNWDPASLREHALRWIKPENEEKPVDVPQNVCAFLGFAALSSMLVGNRLKTCGVDPQGAFFSWRLPQAPVQYAEALSATTTVSALSGTMVWASKRITLDKGRHFFAPATCQG